MLSTRDGEFQEQYANYESVTSLSEKIQRVNYAYNSIEREYCTTTDEE